MSSYKEKTTNAMQRNYSVTGNGTEVKRMLVSLTNIQIV
jgi:hypothetical protein